jgi:hypothetical protein
VAAPLRDERDARCSRKRAVVPDAHVVPQEAKVFVTGVTRVFVSESSNPNFSFSNAATAAFSCSASWRARSSCCGPGGAPTRSKKSSAYLMGTMTVSPRPRSILRA